MVAHFIVHPKALKSDKVFHFPRNKEERKNTSSRRSGRMLLWLTNRPRGAVGAPLVATAWGLVNRVVLGCT